MIKYNFYDNRKTTSHLQSKIDCSKFETRQQTRKLWAYEAARIKISRDIESAQESK